MSYQFQYQYFIYLFALLAVLLLIYVFYNRWRNKKLTIIGLPSLVRSMMPGYSAVRANGKFAMLSIAFIAGVLTVMHLRKPGDSGGISRKGIDVVFALDVSRSMLATDIAPSRLDRARQLMIKLIDKLPNDRIGLVVFAGQAYLQMPLTTDHGAASLYINTASPESVPSQGTILSEALLQSSRAFNSAERRFKAVVLLTDGEDHDEMALKTAKEMAEQGMLINTIGIGTTQGSKIPDPVTGGFKKDQMGNEVVSKLNENILKQLAETANGVYVPLSDGDAAIDKIVSQLSQIEKKTIIDTSLVNYHSYYWIFAGLMLLLLILEFFISPSKKQKA